MSNNLFYKEDLVSNETREIVLFTLSILQSPVILCGWITNLINIITFIRLGLKDSITLSFFFLTCSDLICLVIIFPGIYLAYILPYLFMNWPAGSSMNLVVVIYYYLMFYDVSKMITTFIALQRCCCVAMPFQFKNTFTCTKLSNVSDHLLLVLLRSDAWRDYAIAYDIINSILLTTVCHITVLTCLFILVSNLTSSSRFRHSASLHRLKMKKLENRKKIQDAKFHKSYQKGKEKVDADKINLTKTFNTKEIQAIKSTILLSIIFLVCNTPKVLMGYAKLIEPRFSVNKQFSNLHFICGTVKNTLEIINASASMFVYLACNTRYRQTLISYMNTVCVKWFKQKTTPASVNNGT
ncbi:unnamed protein product [Candidula unifasciata]|uniref:G-protein coupled receptors family 1 profile domain-containing protein n=1 Tax=Candidula unifasciata TaxID=100452 RepID=A0A8S4A3F9_9EUPU|nr:unnamed protein product [Candidula unifasciata]